MSKTIAQALRLAADRHLSATGQAPWRGCTFSCDAVGRVTKERDSATHDFLASLGCPVNSLGAFIEFEPGPVRQAVRYAWLMFAADIADGA